MRRAALVITLALALAGCNGGDGGIGGEKIRFDGCGHAHDDYEHERPLLDALDAGFCSVEVDVHLVGGDVVVSHDTPRDLTRTLPSLYLDPLRAIAQANGGTILESGEPLTLLIDVKTDAVATWAALDLALAQYDDILTSFVDGVTTERAVTAIISGGRDRAAMAAASTRYAALDGRPDDLRSGAPVSLIPLVSDGWYQHFTWNGGDLPMPDDQRLELRTLLRTAHSEGRRVRFWATEDSPEVWRELVDANVDLVNADDLAGLRDFLDDETD